MKRKFTNVFLLVAISVAALTSFVSCKDYQDDMYADMDLQDKNLRDALTALQTTLQTQITNLQTAQQNCSTNCSTAQANLWAKFADYYTKTETYNQTEINQMIQDLKDLMGTVSDNKTLSDMISDAQTAAQGALTAAQTAQSAAETAQGLADRDSVRLDAVDKALIALSDSLKHAYETADLAFAFAERDSVRIDGLDKTVKSLRTYCDSIFATKARVDQVGDSAIKAFDKAVANEIAIKNLDSIVTIIRDSLSKFATKEEVAAADKKLNERIDSVIDATKGWKDSIAAVREEAQEIRELAKTYLDSALNVSQEIQDSLDNYIKANDARVQAVEDSITDLRTAITALEGRVKFLEDSIPGIDKRLDALEDSIANIMPRLKALEDKVEELEGKVEKLENRLNQLITGIIVQQAVNPIFGSINLPWGFNSKLLTVYYGSATNLGVEFPTMDEALFYDGKSILTKEDLEVFKGTKFTKGANEPLYLDKEGNAGYLYVTVNPTDVDFTGTKFSLVTSQEKEIVTLGNLQKTTDELKFGWTRGEVASKSSNGLYKASVTIQNGKFAQAAPRVNLNVNDVKDALQEVVASAKSKSISTIAQSLVQAGVAVSPLAEANFPAYAVKAAWTPKDGNPTAVYSGYEVGAIAVKPLSYAFAKDLVVKNIPGIGVLEDGINRLTTAAKTAVAKAIPNNLFKFINPNLSAKDLIFDRSQLQEIDFKGARDKIKVNFKLNVSVPVDYSTTVHQDITINGSATVPGQSITIPPAEVAIPQSAINGLEMVIPADQSWDGLVHTYYVQANSDIAGTASIDEVTIKPQTATTTGSTSVDIPITISTTIDIKDYDVSDQMKTQILNIYDGLSGALQPVNTMITALSAYMENVNGLIKGVNNIPAELEKIVDSNMDKLSGKLIDLLNKVNDKLVPYMQPNDWVQPIMVGSANGFFRFTTTTATNPQLINSGDLTLIPTTRTAELLSPAFKKWIAVTDVIQGANSAKGGDPTCIDARTNANKASNINEVLDGNVRAVLISLEKGYTYELTYQALDYTGRVAAKKYYVRVK